jgi:hydroxypyruvate reductase
MTDAKPGLLLWSESSERLLGDSLEQTFEYIRVWQSSDFEALLDARGRDIVATITTSFDNALFDRMPNLRLIAVPGAGYEGIDTDAAHARGVKVANAGNTHSAEVADHAVALVLASLSRLVASHAFVLNGRWERGESTARRHSLSAQRFGIVGLGNIGTAIAERLAVFGGEIAWWGPRAKPAAWPRRESLSELAEWCTVLIVATRGDTPCLIDTQTIASVGPDGLIVNISRGAVIDEEALIVALKSGTLGAAALDVFAHEPTPAERWSDVPNVLLTPHVAGVTHESMKKLREAAIRNLLTAVKGGPLVHEL